MSGQRSVDAGSTVDGFHSETFYRESGSSDRAYRLADEIRNRWEKGETADVAAALTAHPELTRLRTVVLELAHAEYSQRCQRGEALDIRDFAERFSDYETSLYLFLNVRNMLDDEDSLGDDEAIEWPEPGESFLGFSLLEELGRGAFARVFLAAENALGGRLVALKVSSNGSSEATILGRLNHPGIVPVHSVREDEETGFTAVCMGFLGRVTLADVLDYAFDGGVPPRQAHAVAELVAERSDPSDGRQKRTPSWVRKTYPDAIAEFALQLAEALAYSHGRGICHRDLKPSNVLLASDGRCLLFDFNLSTADSLEMERIGGTLPYMAPEQLATVRRANPAFSAYADPRSDLFGLGVILYQLLTGSLPFEPDRWGGSIEDVVDGLLAAERRGARPLRQLNRSVDARLERIVLKCLAFDPGDRFATAGELAVELRGYFQPRRRVKRWVERHPWHVGFVAILAFLVLAAWGTFLALRPPYSERMLNHATALYEQGRYKDSITFFDESLEADPDCVEAHVGCGRAYLKLGEYRDAFDKFHDANKISGDADCYAAEGYCASKMGKHNVAISCYGEAIRRGNDAPSVLNNSGYSHLRLAHLERAEQCFEQAIAEDAALASAHVNLVTIQINRVRLRTASVSKARSVVDRALQNSSPSATLFRNAAVFFALAAKRGEDCVPAALSCLRLAVHYGQDTDALVSDVSFQELHDLPEFEKILKEPSLIDQPVEVERLVTPLQGMIQ